MGKRAAEQLVAREWADLMHAYSCDWAWMTGCMSAMHYAGGREMIWRALRIGTMAIVYLALVRYQSGSSASCLVGLSCVVER